MNGVAAENKLAAPLMTPAPAAISLPGVNPCKIAHTVGKTNSLIPTARTIQITAPIEEGMADMQGH